MPIFDKAIFDGPPSSTIFDTGGAISVTRVAVRQAQIHDTSSSGALHGVLGDASIHDKQSSGRVSN